MNIIYRCLGAVQSFAGFDCQLQKRQPPCESRRSCGLGSLGIRLSHWSHSRLPEITIQKRSKQCSKWTFPVSHSTISKNKKHINQVLTFGISLEQPSQFTVFFSILIIWGVNTYSQIYNFYIVLKWSGIKVDLGDIFSVCSFFNIVSLVLL